MTGNGTLPPETDPGQLALALLAAVEGGLLLAQAQHADALEAALDTVIAHIRDHAAEAAPVMRRAPNRRTPGPGRRTQQSRPSSPARAARLLPGLLRHAGASPQIAEQLNLGGRHRAPSGLHAPRPSHVKLPSGTTSSRHDHPGTNCNQRDGPHQAGKIGVNCAGPSAACSMTMRVSS